MVPVLLGPFCMIFVIQYILKYKFTRIAVAVGSTAIRVPFRIQNIDPETKYENPSISSFPL